MLWSTREILYDFITQSEVISSHFPSLDSFWGLPPWPSAIASLAPACIMSAGRRWINHGQSWQPLSPRNQFLAHRPMQTLELPSVNRKGKSDWMRVSEREAFGLFSNCYSYSIKTDNCAHVESMPKEHHRKFHIPFVVACSFSSIYFTMFKSIPEFHRFSHQNLHCKLKSLYIPPGYLIQRFITVESYSLKRAGIISP